MTFRELAGYGQAQLQKERSTGEETRLEVRILMEHCFGLSLAQILLKDAEPAPEEGVLRFKELIARRKNDEPIAYILGEWEFMGLPMKLNSSTLIPRQDTELLAETALEALSQNDEPAKILDLCTGSGCIIVSLGYHLHRLRPQKLLTLVAADVEPNVAGIVQENAKRAETDVVFRLGDLFDALEKDERFDLIVSNPPYISSQEMKELDRDVVLYEPSKALYGGEDGLDFYRRIVENAPVFLVNNGLLMLEIGDTQGQDVSDMMYAAGFADVKILKDYAGHDRVVTGRKKEGRHGRSFGKDVSSL